MKIESKVKMMRMMRKNFFLWALSVPFLGASLDYAFADALPDVVARVADSVCRVEVRRYGEDPDAVWERLWKGIQERKIIPQAYDPGRVPRDGPLNIEEEKPLAQRPVTGSCAVIGPEEVLTNYHVVETAASIKISFENVKGSGFPATVYRFDQASDVAILSVPEMKTFSDPPRPVTFGRSSLLRSGETIFIVGFPFGGVWKPNGTWASSVVSGVVSNEIFSKLRQWVQVNSDIVPGYSGGALFNLSGEYVGMATSALGKSGGGINYVIASDSVQEIIVQLRRYGSVKRGAIGISVDAVNAVLAYQAFQWGISPEIRSVYGLKPVVTGIVPDSPAGSAGIQAGDIILEINGVAVDTALDSQRKIVQYRPGEEIQLLLLRNGMRLTTRVVLGDDDALFRFIDGSVL